MLNHLKVTIDELIKVNSLPEKVSILDNDPLVQKFLTSHPLRHTVSKGSLSLEHDYIIKSLMVINQADNILQFPQNLKNLHNHLKSLLQNLYEIDQFYQEMGGIIGYHYNFIQLVHKKDQSCVDKDIHFYDPPFTDIRSPSFEVQQYIDSAIDNLDLVSMVFPIGGAGDRLGLIDSNNKESLPTAKLNFLGHNLLEGLIRDIEALEYLYFKTFNKNITIPIVMMTSDVKNNHKLILKLCETKNWFNRPVNSFFIIKQLQVPMITEEGNWALKGPLSLALRPGGHGMLWKLMQDNNVFDWLKLKNKTKIIVRQINNPVAAVDYSLLAFMGIGFQEDKAFGLASCPREVNSAEGVNILKEKKVKKGYNYNISNIEYTDFKKYDIEDCPMKKNSLYSKFPSNTNLLFGDINRIQEATKKSPYPGMTINLKNKAYTKDEKGKTKEIKAGRLEFMMQNIADTIVDFSQKKMPTSLKTYLSFNIRKKTISVTKKKYHIGSSYQETPETCFYDILSNYHDLLSNYCNIKMPSMTDTSECLLKGPPFMCLMHPMIGPMYSTISKKIIGGEIKKYSELQLEIAEVLFENLFLDGSLLIQAPLIKKDPKERYYYPKCILQNIKIKNSGIDRKQNNIYWKNEIKRLETLKIILHENSIFYAKNIEFNGNIRIEVPSFHKMTAFQINGNIQYKIEEL